jgi:hypothetical protein
MKEGDQMRTAWDDDERGRCVENGWREGIMTRDDNLVRMAGEGDDEKRQSDVDCLW